MATESRADSVNDILNPGSRESAASTIHGAIGALGGRRAKA